MAVSPWDSDQGAVPAFERDGLPAGFLRERGTELSGELGLSRAAAGELDDDPVVAGLGGGPDAFNQREGARRSKTKAGAAQAVEWKGGKPVRCRHIDA